MNFSSTFLFRGAAWTIGAFALGQLVRLVTNVILTRLLAPELFGIMVIINSVRTGLELFSDIGITQNIVHNPNAEKPEFYNTAWTLQLIRAVILWSVFVAAAPFIAHIYETPILTSLIPVAGLVFVIAASGSVAVPLIQKRIRFVRLNLFDLVHQIISSAGHIVLAYFVPTIWALVVAGVFSTAVRSIGTYIIMPSVKPKFHISRQYALQILTFGQWIFISSIIFFLSTNFDRLYVGKVAALGIVGIYGIARGWSDLVGLLVGRVSAYIVFPLVAGSQTKARSELRAALKTKRLAFLLFCAIAVAVLTSVADIGIGVIYDDRYHAAKWMLPILLVGAWFSIVANLNELVLFGVGRSLYGAAANACKFAWLLVGFSIGATHFGLVGIVLVVATSDICRCVPILFGQVRENISFARQDIVITIVMFSVIVLLQYFRWTIGWGTSFDGFPVDVTG